MDGDSTNAKISRMLLKEESKNSNGKPAPTASLKLKTSFIRNEKNYFMLFCAVHLIKSIRNALFKKGNDFFHPKLVLSEKKNLEEGVCSVKCMRDLHH